MEYNNLAPVCLFTYNRLIETKQTVEALKKNFLSNETELFIFSDGWKNEEGKEKVLEVRNFLKTITGFKEIVIIEEETNKGLANSIINGVTDTINSYGKVIVLEDDLVTTPNFLDFMNQALSHYENIENIWSISGFSLNVTNNSSDDVYFHRRAFSWGWGTWKDKWNNVVFEKEEVKKIILDDANLLKGFKLNCGDDIDGMLLDCLNERNNSWYVRFAFSQFWNKGLTVYPYFSKVKNIGFEDNGTHCGTINVYKSVMDTTYSSDFKFTLPNESERTNKQYLTYFKSAYKIKFRIKLLSSSNGRTMLYSDMKSKFFKLLNK